MRIGVTCYPTAGGSGILATELGRAMAERGHSIHFVCYDVPARLQYPYHKNVFFHQVDVSTYPLFKYPPYVMALTTKMAEVAELEALDILHSHYAIPHALSAHLAQEMVGSDRLKVVTTLHGTDITLVGTDPSFFPITKFSIQKSDAVTCVSEWLRKRTIEEFGLENEILMIPNFVDTEVFDRDKRDRPCFDSGSGKIIMHISNFRPVKRVQNAIRIFARVAEKVDCRLLMIGDGPERFGATQLANELGVTEKTVFLGNQNKVEDLLACADLLLVPSEYESFGLIALEAMSCRVPVVASKAGGLVEVIEDGECGFLVDPDDIDTMAERSLRILTDPNLSEQMGRKGRERAKTVFNPEKIVSQYEALYQKVLSS